MKNHKNITHLIYIGLATLPCIALLLFFGIYRISHPDTGLTNEEQDEMETQIDLTISNAVTTSDVHVCDSLPKVVSYHVQGKGEFIDNPIAGTSNRYPAASCYKEYAAQKNDLTVCELIRNVTFDSVNQQGNCYFGVAIRNHHLDGCEKMRELSIENGSTDSQIDPTYHQCLELAQESALQ